MYSFVRTDNNKKTRRKQKARDPPTLLVDGVQETMAAMAKSQGGAHVSVSKLNNVLMQMRKNCNHPDLIKGAFDGSITYPPSEEIRAQCGKMQLLERMLHSLHKGGHKVLIFSQVSGLHHVKFGLG